MATAASLSAQRLCVGVITGPHGVRGAVRVRSFTEDPRAIESYGLLSDAGGERSFALHLTGTLKDCLLAIVEGVEDREVAASLTGLRLYVRRDQLPEAEEDEFYHADLLGCAAVLASGEALGNVAAIHDFGAGISLEIMDRAGQTVMVPFVKSIVPTIDLKAKTLMIVAPPGLLDKPEPPVPLAEQIAAAAGGRHP